MLSRHRLPHAAGLCILATTSAYAQPVDWNADRAPAVSATELLPEVSLEVSPLGRGAPPFAPDQRPISYLPLASNGKSCSNIEGFPFWRTLWEPDPRDAGQRPPAIYRLFETIDNQWNKGYRRFMLHRFGGDQGGGLYSSAQWWTFDENARNWFLRDDYADRSGVPMGLTAYIAQKKAIDPDAEFYIYLGPELYKVDSLLQEEAPFTKTAAWYNECDPLGADPLDLIPDDIEDHELRLMCLTGDPEMDTKNANQLWLTLGAFTEMGFDGAYFDALGGPNDYGAICAGDIGRLPQYADRGFRIGIEPMAVDYVDRKHVPQSEVNTQAPSISNYRFLGWRIGVTEDASEWKPEWDMRHSGHEAAIIIHDRDWSTDRSAGADPADGLLTIDRFYQLVQHGYTPAPRPNTHNPTDDAIAFVMGIGEPSCPADLNFDGQVTFRDLLLLINRFNNPPDPVLGKLNLYHGDYADDNKLSFADIATFIRFYAAGCN